MKNFYIVFTTDYIGTTNTFTGEVEQDHKYFADVMKVSESDNLKCRLEHIGGLIHANICSTKKEAERIAEKWNERYRVNGTYLYA